MPEERKSSSETFYFYFEGKEHHFRVEELNDGMWLIHCDHHLFKEVFGGPKLKSSVGVVQGLEKLEDKNKDLMDAMLQPFYEAV